MSAIATADSLDDISDYLSSEVLNSVSDKDNLVMTIIKIERHDARNGSKKFIEEVITGNTALVRYDTNIDVPIGPDVASQSVILEVKMKKEDGKWKILEKSIFVNTIGR